MVKHEDKTSVCFGEVSAPFSVLSCFGNVTGHRLHATKKKKNFWKKKKRKMATRSACSVSQDLCQKTNKREVTGRCFRSIRSLLDIAESECVVSTWQAT